jgi:hypothetical protein
MPWMVRRAGGAAWRRVLVGIAAAMLVLPASVGAQERRAPALFAATGLADVPAGATIGLRHERRTEPPDPAAALDGRIEIAITEADGSRQAVVALLAGEERRVLPPMPAGSAHPVLLVFLESIVASMSSATGGNPTYIRNRLRDALWLEGDTEPDLVRVDGTVAPAEMLTVRPFGDDPQRGAMGGFAELELRFLLSDAVPGGIGRLEADTAAHDLHPALVERMTWDGLEADE